jgi:hypothetical protein
VHRAQDADVVRDGGGVDVGLGWARRRHGWRASSKYADGQVRNRVTWEIIPGFRPCANVPAVR